MKLLVALKPFRCGMGWGPELNGLCGAGDIFAVWEDLEDCWHVVGVTELVRDLDQKNFDRFNQTTFITKDMMGEYVAELEAKPKE